MRMTTIFVTMTVLHLCFHRGAVAIYSKLLLMVFSILMVFVNRAIFVSMTTFCMCVITLTIVRMFIVVCVITSRNQKCCNGQ